MPWFEYKAVTRYGTLLVGRLEAAVHDKAIQQLADLGLDVREVAEAEAPPSARAGISADDLIFFNAQLASLADAGIALDQGLAQLARDVESPRLRRWILELVGDVRRGVPLDQAVAAREKGLPVLYSQVLRAGVQSGELPAVLLNLNQHLRLIGTTRRILWETASYPLMVVTLAVLVASFFFIALMPQFKEIYADFDTQLPAITLLLIAIADHYLAVLGVLAVLVIGGAALWQALRFSSGGRAVREELLAATPVVGRIHRASLLARFLRSVSTAVATGVPLPEAIRLGAGATGHEGLMADAAHLAAEVERGQSIFVANQSARLVPPLFGFCVQTAKGRDALPEAIDKLAQSYESRAVHAQAMLRTILFPLMVVVLGGFLAIGIIGLFMPLVSLINALSG